MLIWANSRPSRNRRWFRSKTRKWSTEGVILLIAQIPGFLRNPSRNGNGIVSLMPTQRLGWSTMHLEMVLPLNAKGYQNGIRWLIMSIYRNGAPLVRFGWNGGQPVINQVIVNVPLQSQNDDWNWSSSRVQSVFHSNEMGHRPREFTLEKGLKGI